MQKGMPLLLLLAALAFQQTPIIRVPVHLVTVPVLVLSKEGRLIPALEKSDFRVFDNGRLQTVTLDTEPLPVSVALVVQASQDVRQYLPFIARVGSALEALLVGHTGEAALVTYHDDVAVQKPFTEGDVATTLRKVSPSGKRARMIDAGLRGLALLRERPGPRSRVLLFIGQPMDDGSESRLDDLREQAERDNVSIYALTLPELGKAFVSDTFSLEALSSREDRGGFKAGTDLKKLIPIVTRTVKAASSADPFSILTSATGGTQLHFRKQGELENAISIVGVELRSVYLLSYYPGDREPGYHTIRVDVGVPGATVHARPGYWMVKED
jgi:VWFA-related protein